MALATENGTMPRKPKKTVKPVEDPKPDLHQGAPFTMRLPADMLAVLDAVAGENDRSRTGEIRLAIRKHLIEIGRWPPGSKEME